MKYLTKDDAVAAVWGGLVLGAGGGGLESGLAGVDVVFEIGRPRLAGLDELPDDALAIVSTGVGAPGAKTSERTVYPRDSVQAVDMIRARLRAGAFGHHRDSIGTIVGHPGASVRSWLHSALDDSQYVIDCATNGRGHPSVRMGSMGITDDLTHKILLAAVGGLDDVAGRMEILIESPLALGSDVVRRAAALLGGSISAARGPFTIQFLRDNGAIGSVSLSISVGQAMLDVAGRSGPQRIDAVVSALGGTVATEGRIVSNSIQLDGAYDVGTIELDTGAGAALLGVVNEYLTLDVDGERVSTFPDLIVLFRSADAQPVAASPAAVGEDVVVVTVPRSKIPVGAGVYESAAYPGVEKLLGLEIARYL